MAKIIVNDAFLDSLIEMFGGDNDDAYEYYKSKNMQTEQDFKEIIRKEVVPYFNIQYNQVKDKMKLTLKYYLSKPEYDFERVFDSCLPSFDIPKEDKGKLFFLWIWEELFENEEYLVTSLDDYEENRDCQEIGRMNEIIKEYGEYSLENLQKRYTQKDDKWVRFKK